MKPEEAIEIIESTKELYKPAVVEEAFDMGIEALKEVQEYRKFGTIEELTDFFAVINEDSDNAGEDGLNLEIIKNLIELNQFRKIGTVEEVQNQKHNLEIAYKIIGEYESIGTVEECREVVEKQKPASRVIIEGKYYCPKCKNLMTYPGYCRCGQKVY